MMSKKAIVSVVGCLLMLALLPGIGEAAKEKPQYGGLFTTAQQTEPVGYDAWNPIYSAPFVSMMYEQLAIGDFFTGKDKWPFYGWLMPKSLWRGQLAESWESPDHATAIFHLRKGVRFQDLPPVNGRELVADDVVYSFNRNRSEKSPARGRTALRSLKSVKALDKYTVEFKFDPPHVEMWEILRRCYIVPHELVERDGDLANPKHAVGTGPFMVDEIVSGSSMKFKKNPKYWGKHPDTGDRLPFLDGCELLIISDESTRIAALRTGKVDALDRRPWLNTVKAKSLMKTTPRLKYRNIAFERAVHVCLRNDLKPFSDIKVRQALSMAIDREVLVKDYYRGYASYPTWPVPKGWSHLYVPLAELPANVRKVYDYNPEAAKRLLAEAGYPNGFRTTMLVSNQNADYKNTAQIIKEWWKQNLNVDVEIQTLDRGPLISRYLAHSYEGMLYEQGGLSAETFGVSWFYQPEDEAKFRMLNFCNVRDPKYNATYDKIIKTFDDQERFRLIKEAGLYGQEQVWRIDMPLPELWLFWWPWIKGGYWGQVSLTFASSGEMYKYFWIDQNLKKEILGE